MLNDDTKQEILDEYKQDINNSATMCVCAVCGIIEANTKDSITDQIFNLKHKQIQEFKVTDRKYLKGRQKHLRHIVQIKRTHFHLVKEGLLRTSSKTHKWWYQSRINKNTIIYNNAQKYENEATLENTSAYMCSECLNTDNKKRFKRSMKHADYGHIPEILKRPENQLNRAEKIALRRYIPAARVQKLRMTRVDGKYIKESAKCRLFGHSIVIPYTNVMIKETDKALPRTDIAEHLKIVFIGTKSSWKIA